MNESDVRQPVLYWILCIPRNTVYVGSTTRSFRERWRWHLRRLRKSTHNNSFLQRAWDKHGEQAFEFRILTCVQDTSRILQVEQDWLDNVRLDGYEVFNGSTLVTATFLGRHHTPEARRKISESMKGNKRFLGRKKSPEAIAAAVKARARRYPALINMYTLQMVGAGSNVAKMCRENGLTRRTILHLVNGEVEQTRDGWVTDTYYE